MTEQLVTPDVVDNMQVGELRVPPVVPGVRVNVTVPVGVLKGLVASATVAVTLAVQLVAPRAMLQLTFPTLVEVLSFATVMVFDVPILPLCVESPLYVPVTVAVPTATLVKVTEQLAVVGDKGQLAPTVPTAVFDDAKLTEPVGVLDAVVVSVTEAVQVEVPPGTIVVGLQATTVLVVSST
jgi:hypothetical protein